MESLDKLIGKFPPFYRYLLPEVFFESYPAETIATCHDCVMCRDYLGKKERGERYFIPETKCCTYQPYLPNYLAGAILTEAENSEGAGRLRKMIMQGFGITPAFVRPSALHVIKYNAFAQLSFGKNKDFKCSFYQSESGACTIYPYWNGICSTFYCKSVGGKYGQKFWESTRDVLKKVEKLLAVDICVSLGLEALEQPKLVTPDRPDGTLDHKLYNSLWKNWKGREVDFYKESYKALLDLSKDEFNIITDPSLKELIIKMKEAKVIFEEEVEGTRQD